MWFIDIPCEWLEKAEKVVAEECKADENESPLSVLTFESQYRRQLVAVAQRELIKVGHRWCVSKAE